MTQIVPKPPALLDGARVLEYAVLDNSVRYSGHSSLFIDGKEVGPVPCLAIGQEAHEADVLLLHCSDDWEVVGVAVYPSVAEAKNAAERIYPGTARRWVATQNTEEKVKSFDKQIWASKQCSFCGRVAREVKQLITKNNLSVCNFCIAELHELLQEDETP